MNYRVRSVVPTESAWFECEAASPEEAANEVHARETHAHLPSSFPSLRIHDRTEEGTEFPAIVCFARMEVEGHGTYISRVYLSAIWRKGGVSRKPALTIQAIADRLAWSHPAEELLEVGWVGEESEEEARARKRAF